MGTLLVIVLLAVVGYVVWKLIKDPDKNDDGKVDAQDIVVAAKEVVAEVKHEAKEAAADVKAEATKVVEKVKKARKPRAKKA